MTSPRCSVIIPVFNRASQIEETLQSVWNQTFTDFEVIIVDDGSTDDLDAVLQSQSDTRLRVLSQPNSGPAAARNRGLHAANGDFVAYLDSDDQWFPNHLQDTIAELDQTKAPAIYSPMVVDRGVGRYAVRPSRPMRSDESFGDYRFVDAELVLLSTVLHRTDLREKVRWNEELFYGDVDQFMLDLIAETGPIPMLSHATAVYNDITGPHKLSQASVYERDDPKFTSFLAWLEEQDGLSEQAVAAHRARNLSGVQKRNVDTIKLLGGAYRSGAMTASGALREYVRARKPQAYRYLIDTYVYLRGEPFESLVSHPDGDLSPGSQCEICAAQDEPAKELVG